MIMKSKWIKSAATVGAVLIIGLCLLPWSLAQEPEEAPLAEHELEVKEELKQLELLQARRAVAEASRALAEEHKRMGAKMKQIRKAPGSLPALRQAAEALRDAEGDEAKADAESKLRELLADYFDEDMERRAAELEQIEQRVSTLREQLERRGNHKPEIIDLQVKVLVNEAEGLGFFSDTGSEGFIFTRSDDPWTISGPPMAFPAPIAAPAAVPAPPAPPTRARVEKRGRPMADGYEPR
jgi:hypothetical protein